MYKCRSKGHLGPFRGLAHVLYLSGSQRNSEVRALPLLYVCPWRTDRLKFLIPMMLTATETKIWCSELHDSKEKHMHAKQSDSCSSNFGLGLGMSLAQLLVALFFVKRKTNSALVPAK